MSALPIEDWCKTSDDEKSIPIGKIHFYVGEGTHLRMEQAEERYRVLTTLK